MTIFNPWTAWIALTVAMIVGALLGYVVRMLFELKCSTNETQEQMNDNTINYHLMTAELRQGFDNIRKALSAMPSSPDVRYSMKQFHKYMQEIFNDTERGDARIGPEDSAETGGQG